MITRRSLLAGAAGLTVAVPVLPVVAAGVTPAVANSAKTARDLDGVSIYVPGYRPHAASRNGAPIAKSKSGARNISNFKKPYRLLSKVSLDGTITQALMPTHAHDVKIAPDKSVGLFCGFEKRDHVAFDPQTLDLVATAHSFKKGWRGGGHGVYLDNGTALLSERAPRRALRHGNVKKQYGRITIRDAKTLKITQSYSSYGIDPHEIGLIEDGRYLVVANYGSVPKKGKRMRVPRDVAEACVVIIDMASGKLVEKIVTNKTHNEARHLAAGAMDRIFLIQARLGKDVDGNKQLKDMDIAYQLDITTERDNAYMSAATLKLESGKKPMAMGDAAAVAQMRHGLSIRYDRIHDEVIASYPSAHRVMVFDGASGQVKRIVNTMEIGLRYPCGVTMLPDGKHYVVAGYWENIFVFELGNHKLVREMCLYPTLFGHSHIWAA